MPTLGSEPGPVSVAEPPERERTPVSIEVGDEGRGHRGAPDSPGIGHGLATVGALVQTLEIWPREDGPGTVVTMSFASVAEPPAAPGLEPLCGLRS